MRKGEREKLERLLATYLPCYARHILFSSKEQQTSRRRRGIRPIGGNASGGGGAPCGILASAGLYIYAPASFEPGAGALFIFGSLFIIYCQARVNHAIHGCQPARLSLSLTLLWPGGFLLHALSFLQRA